MGHEIAIALRAVLALGSGALAMASPASGPPPPARPEFQEHSYAKPPRIFYL